MERATAISREQPPPSVERSLARIEEELARLPGSEEAREHLAYLREVLADRESQRASLARLLHEVKSPQAALENALHEIEASLGKLLQEEASEPSLREMLEAGQANPFWSSEERRQRQTRIEAWQPELARTMLRRLAYLPDPLLDRLRPVLANAPTLERLLLAFEAGTAWRTANLSAARIRQLTRHLHALTHTPFPHENTVDLVASLKEALTLLEHPLRDIQLELDLPPSLLVAGQALALQQIWTNLMTNAAEAITDQGDGSGGIIRVLVTEEAEHIAVQIRDNGPGLPAIDPERLFEPAFTTKTGRNRQNTGLGLAITRDIVERLGGQITAHPAPEGGAEFIVRLQHP